MKALGAQVIAFGIVMLALQLVGMRLALFWFLDALGPIAAYLLKFGFIVLGAWIWRSADRGSAVEDDVTEDESRRAWIPVITAGALIVGIIAFLAASVIRDNRLKQELTRDPAPAAWAAVPPNLWPDLALMQKAKFSHHTDMEAGCGCLVRLPTGEICALTAGHLLGQAGGVKPGFVHLGSLDKDKLATLDAEIASWKMYSPNATDDCVNVTGLYGKAKQFDETCDQVLLRLAPNTNGYPVTPLDLRLSPVLTTETLYMITYDWDDKDSAQQVVHKVHRVPGFGFTCLMENPAELNGFSGAPIVDKNGLLVGILTGGSILDSSPTGYTHAFTGHLASELMPVLKDALALKGSATLTPIKTVRKNKTLPTIQTGTTVSPKPVGDAI